MKELTGKSGIDKPSFPQKIVIDKTEIVGKPKLLMNLIISLQL